jgi:hypothetical protein
MKIHLLISLIFVFFACSSKSAFKEKEYNVKKTNVSTNSLDSIGCYASIDLDNKLKDIINFPQKYLQGNDNCKLALIDSIVNRAKKSENDYLLYESLEMLSSVSDGAISEYFPFVLNSLFYDDYENFSQFIYERSKKKKKNSFLKKFLIEGMCIQIVDSKSPNEERIKIFNFIHEKTNGKDLDFTQFMNEIIKEIDVSNCD